MPDAERWACQRFCAICLLFLPLQLAEIGMYWNFQPVNRFLKKSSGSSLGMWFRDLGYLTVPIKPNQVQDNHSLVENSWKAIEESAFSSFFTTFTLVLASLLLVGLLITFCCLIKDTRMADSIFGIFRSCCQCCGKGKCGSQKSWR